MFARDSIEKHILNVGNSSDIQEINVLINLRKEIRDLFVSNTNFLKNC